MSDIERAIANSEQKVQDQKRLEQLRIAQKEERKDQIIQLANKDLMNLWSKAEEAATPFIHKLEESGIIDVLDDLREATYLCYRQEDNERIAQLRERKGQRYLSRKVEIDTPAKIEIATIVSIGPSDFYFSDMNLTHSGANYYVIEQLKQIRSENYNTYREATSCIELQSCYRRETEKHANYAPVVKSCGGSLVWDHDRNKYSDLDNNGDTCYRSAESFRKIRFDLSRPENTWVYQLKIGDSILPERDGSRTTWDRSQVEQAVADAYVQVRDNDPTIRIS